MAMQAWTILAGYKSRRAASKSSPQRNNNNNDDHNGVYEMHQVEELLDYVHRLYAGGYPHVVPNTVLYNIWISGWARLSPYHSKACLETEKVLRKMISLSSSLPEVQPDHLSYTKVILAWAEAASHKPTAGQRAEWWLSKLIEEYKSSLLSNHSKSDDDDDNDDASNHNRLRPRIGTYNAVLKAWRNTGDAARAEQFFQRTLQDGGLVKANTESFALLIHTWLQQHKKNKGSLPQQVGVRKAHEWLQTLLRLQQEDDHGGGGVAVTTTTTTTTTPDMYEGILKGIAQSPPSREMLDMAIDTLQSLVESRHHVGWQVFGWTMETAMKLGRVDIVKQLLRQCCDDGLLSGPLVRLICNGPVYAQGWTVEASERVKNKHLLQLVMGNDKEPTPASFSLPPTWTRNLTDDNLLPKQADTQRRPVQMRLTTTTHENTQTLL